MHDAGHAVPAMVAVVDTGEATPAATPVATPAAMEARAEARAGVVRRLALLTGRERQVFERVVQGLPNKQIAAQLGIALKTVKVHRGRVMLKMEAASVADLVRFAASVGL